MRHRRLLFLIAIFLALWLPAGSTADIKSAQLRAVDLNLVIAVDCSYSVDTVEFDLQRHGIADAFRDPEVQSAIAGGQHGAIAVSILQWSSRRSQIVAIPWMVVSDAASANALASAAVSMPRETIEGATSIAAAIDAASQLIAESPYPASRYVIDVQADGTNNNGPVVDDARDRALAQGITINGLTIINEISWLHFYFRNHVIGGPGAFVEIANDYKAYGRAIKRKLLREIAPPFVADRQDGRQAG